MVSRHSLLHRNVTEHLFLRVVVASHRKLDALAPIWFRKTDFFRSLFSLFGFRSGVYKNSVDAKV
jgi:hypothetical protein